MRQTPSLIRIGQTDFFREFQLSFKGLCFCLVIYNECEYIRLIYLSLRNVNKNCACASRVRELHFHCNDVILALAAPIVSDR